MDSLTQIVLGGAVGEVVAGRKAGNRAVLWGAVCGTLPDLDVLAAPLLNTVEQLHFHRGPSHSLLFSIVMAPLVGRLIRRIHRKSPVETRTWSWLAFWALVTHPILDCFTTWGTEFFWPFWGERIAFNTVFVVDPLYTVPFLILLVTAMMFHRERKARRWINWAGIVLSTAYLGFCALNKFQSRTVFTRSLESAQADYFRIRSSPTPLNSFLWHHEAEGDTEFYLALHSVLADSPTVHIEKVAKTYELPPALANHPEIRLLKETTKGWYLVEPAAEGWKLSDMRYGRSGFHFAKSEGFVFNYLIPEDYNGKDRDMTLVRGMPTLTGEMWADFLDRIMGK